MQKSALLNGVHSTPLTVPFSVYSLTVTRVLQSTVWSHFMHYTFLVVNITQWLGGKASWVKLKLN